MKKIYLLLALFAIMILSGCVKQTPTTTPLICSEESTLSLSRDSLVLGEFIPDPVYGLPPTYCMSDKEELRRQLMLTGGTQGYNIPLNITCRMPEGYNKNLLYPEPHGYRWNSLYMEAFFDGIYEFIMPSECVEGTNNYRMQIMVTAADDSYKTFSDTYHNIRICVWPKDDVKPEGRLDLKVCKFTIISLC